MGSKGSCSFQQSSGDLKGLWYIKVVSDRAEVRPAYPASVVDDAEIGFVFQLSGLLELAVGALLLDELLHKGLVCGLGEPALLIQQSQHPRRVRLKDIPERPSWPSTPAGSPHLISLTPGIWTHRPLDQVDAGLQV